MNKKKAKNLHQYLCLLHREIQVMHNTIHVEQTTVKIIITNRFNLIR